MWSIHTAALEMLQKTGIVMKHRDARKMLLDAGCRIGRNGRISLPADLIENALKTAPKHIQLYDQNGNPAMDLVGENWFYGTGSDTIFTLDLQTGQRRRTTIEDTANFAKLVDGLKNMDFNISAKTYT
jgi:trimethylamine--corrinoid protein Co-methyltransferase